MEDEIAKKLKTKLFKKTGASAGGCISSGNVYETDKGLVFVKFNSKNGADIMFKGEYYGLEALRSADFIVPKPLIFGENYLCMDYVNLKSLRKYSEELGRNLANLHKWKKEESRFGFDYPTCCGFLPLNNEWQDDWILFYASQRLEPLIKNLEKEYSDRELVELWNQLQLKIPLLFKDVQVTPSLLHGDLWSGNAGETDEGAVTFDPATFYGHDEFDLAIAHMFGGFSSKFFDAYHSIIPKRPGFNQRHDLYLLFHNLNHWAHFGSGYRSSSLSIMRNLCKKS